jgi:hypothetical protein
MAPSCASDIDTLIFVDVDGVLNVSVKDPGNSPLIFDTTNAQLALKRRESPSAVTPSIVARLLSVIEQSLPAVNGEKTAYMDLIADPSNSLSVTLVHNLAKIVSAAGERCGFVLSSTWRKPGLEARVRTLEALMSKCLGKHFCFSDRTPYKAERCAVDRLETLGDYLAALQVKRGEGAPTLRVLVLDDFNVTPLDGWRCEGRKIGSAEDVEMFLSHCAGGDVKVKLLHTYDKWAQAGGPSVEVGTGLQQQHVDDAHAFLLKHSVALHTNVMRLLWHEAITYKTSGGHLAVTDSFTTSRRRFRQMVGVCRTGFVQSEMRSVLSTNASSAMCRLHFELTRSRISTGLALACAVGSACLYAPVLLRATKTASVGT